MTDEKIKPFKLEKKETTQTELTSLKNEIHYALPDFTPIKKNT